MLPKPISLYSETALKKPLTLRREISLKLDLPKSDALRRCTENDKRK
jgi:hypothetical protein